MKIHNLAVVCLAALLIVYSGITLIASAHTTVNLGESVLLDLTLPSKNPPTRPGFIALGDPIVDPRPH